MFGWLTPVGDVVETGRYNHAESVKDEPQLRRLLPDFDDWLNEIEEMKNCCSSWEESEGHGEWHQYEIVNDEVTTKIVHALYEAGCLRIGYVGGYLTFEGKPQAIKNLHQKALDLAESLGKVPKFEPIKW